MLAFDRFDALTYTGTISGTGALAKYGAGTLTLTGNNTYTGGTTINAGTLSVAAEGNLGATTGGLTFDGGTLQNTAAFTTQRNITLSARGGTFETQAALTANGVISGAGGLIKTGGATLTLAGANTYSGGTTIVAGTLSVAADGNLGAATGGLAFDGGTMQTTAAFTTPRNVSLSSRGGTLQTDADLTASGTISGAGALTTTGAATLTLTGNNTYTGGTFISNGALQLGNGGTSGSITGDVTNNGVLVINRSDTVSLAGVISGSGAFEQNGTGTTILTGTNTYTGATIVDAGTLEVDGAITSSSTVSVNAGATLTGAGTVDPNPVTIASGGTFAPGTRGAPGSSMTIAGNLAFQSGALYVVYLNTSSTTMANVTGTASLAGTVEADFASGTYLNSKSYDILHSAGLGGTTFGGLTTVNAPNFATSLSYTATDVFLDLTATLGTGTHLTINEQNVANALNNFFNSGGTLPPNFANVFGRTGSNLANTLQQLDGEAATGAERAAFQLTTAFLNLMPDPWAGGGSAGTAPGYTPDEQASLPSYVAEAYAGVLSAPLKQTFDHSWSVWGTGFGGSSRTNGDPIVVGSNNLTASDYGFAAGLDYHATPDTVYGFALAGGGTTWNLAQGLGGGRSDAFQVGVYAKTHIGPAYIAASLAFTNHWFNTTRTAALGNQLAAKFDGQSYGGRLEAGYRYAVRPMMGVTPYAALQAQAFHTPSYSETDLSNTGFGLSYNAIHATDTRSEIGARFDDLIMLGAMPLVLRARAAWAHDWVTNPSLGAVFQTLPSTAFIVNGAVPPKDSALTSAGVELHLTPNWTCAAKFDAEFASGAQTYAGTGTLRYTW